MKINVYWRANDVLYLGHGFVLDGNCLKNDAVRYFLNDKQLSQLENGNMVLHNDIIVIPCMD